MIANNPDSARLETPQSATVPIQPKLLEDFVFLTPELTGLALDTSKKRAGYVVADLARHMGKRPAKLLAWWRRHEAKGWRSLPLERFLTIVALCGDTVVVEFPKRRIKRGGVGRDGVAPVPRHA